MKSFPQLKPHSEVLAPMKQIGAGAAAALAQHFLRAKPADVQEILQTLATLGRARKQGEKFSR